MSVPKLRFPGFVDEWQEYSMGELYTERKEPGNDSLPMLTVSIHSGISDGELDEESLGKTVRRSEDKSTYKHVYAGDLVFNMMRAWQGAIGCARSEGMISPAYISAQPDQRVYPPFMDLYVKRKETIEQINSLSYGVTDFRKRLYWDSFVKVKCKLPTEKEQEKIAGFIELVDRTIMTSENEVQNLETQKKAAMKKIFSQEVRFKQEDGTDFPEWEESTIEDTCDCLDNMRKPITKSDRAPGPYPYYGSTNIQDYVAEYLFDEPLVLLAEDAGPFMEFWERPIAQWAEGKFWVNNHAHVLRPSGNRKFMFYQLEHKDIREFINNPGRGKLNQEDMRKIIVYVPWLNEQKLIADFLSVFDEAISAAKKELKLWKELKKGLLQQMFV